MAYAAVISLKHTIEHLINPTINPQITRSAYEELEFLEDVIKRFYRGINSSIDTSAINALDAETREAVWKLEDVLQSYVSHHSSSDSLGNEGRRRVAVDEEDVKQELFLFLVTLKMLEDEYIIELDNPIYISGEDDDSDELEEIISNEFLDDQSRRKIVSLNGMAGIGKTILARKIYERLINVRRSNVPHFSSTAWVNVGPNRQIENVLVDVLAQIEHKPITSYANLDKHKLANRLRQRLYRRRYFIVLDDLWNTKDWFYLMNFFPEDENESRILLAARLEKVPYPPDAKYVVHDMLFLTTEESWNLLCRNVFGEEYSPTDQLEEAGRKIADNCEGLPLLILAVAKILRRVEKSEEYWKRVADKKTTTFTDAYENISKVLSSSYDPLPEYLKACFLYMGVFPQNSEIPLSKLISLWTVEDFLEPSQSQALEDFAVKCLEELVSKSLVIVSNHSSNHRIKSCKLHSAYWHLCVIKARKIQFLCVLNKLTDDFEDHIQNNSRISVQNHMLLGLKDVNDSMATTSTTRSLLFTGEDHQYPVTVCFDLMFLKVLDALAIRFYEFPNEILKLLQLKYLALTHNGNLPSFISKLQSLQSLIIRQHHNIKPVKDSTYLPMEIWDMQELRHLRIMGSNLPDPSKGTELPNLLTLHVKGHSCTEDVFRSMPKLKKLGIKIELQPRSTEIISCFEHISILDELESLKCVVVNPRPESQVVAPPNPSSSFPSRLKKLSLSGLGYFWEYISAISSLPHLEVLKLRSLAFQGPKWKTDIKQFQSLEFLLLEDLELVHWTTDDKNCFPRLQRLIIHHCYNMEKIPGHIQDIPTLKTIEIVDCHPRLMALAQKIQDIKKDFGNDSFLVPITSSLNPPLQVEKFEESDDDEEFDDDDDYDDEEEEESDDGEESNDD